MENIDPIEVEFLINNQKVQQDARKVKDELKSIGDTAESVAAKVGKNIDNSLQPGKKGFDDVGNSVGNVNRRVGQLNFSVAQITRELPAFTFSAQTGFLALSNNIPILTDQIAKLRAENQLLTQSGGKAVPVWKQLISSFTTFPVLIGFFVTALTLLGPKIGEFISGLFKSKKAIDENKLAIDALNKAYESKDVEKAISNVLELRAAFDSAKKGVLDKEAVLTTYNEKLGDTFGRTNDINEAEKTFRDKSDAYVQAMLFRTAAAQALSDTSKLLVENMKEQDAVERAITEGKQFQVSSGASTFSVGATGFSARTLSTEAKNEEAQLRKELSKLQESAKTIEKEGQNIIQRFTEQAAKIAEAAGLNFDENKNKNETEKILNARRSLLDQIAALDREFARKELTKDEEELQALRDKFAKVREAVRRFNADPKNSKVRIGLADLNTLEAQAEQTLLFRQQTRALERELGEQKKVFVAFEDFKKEVGVEKAKESFAEQLGAFDSFAALLKDKIAQNQEAFDAVANGTATGAQIERVEALKRAQDEQRQAQAENFRKMLADLQNFEQQRNLMIARFEADRQQLINAGETAAASELERRFKEELANFDDEIVQNSEEFKALMSGIEGLSRTAAQAVIDGAKKMVGAMLSAGRITEETAKEILEKIDQLQEEVDNKLSQDLLKVSNKMREIGGAFQNLGDAIGETNEGLGDTITTIGELADVAADAAGSIASFAAGDVIGGIAQGINAVSGILRIGAKARESARKAREELIRLQNEIEDGERRLNELQRQRLIDKAREVELTLEGLKAQREALKLAQQQNQADQDAIFNELQGLQFVASASTKKKGGFLGIGRKTVVVKEYADLLGLTFEEIERLFEQGKLEGRAKDLFEQLRKLKDEGADIQGALDDLEATANNIFTGTTSETIADTIIEGLRQGKNSFEDFAGDVEALLQGAILNAIKFQVLEAPLNKLFEEFANFAESGGELTAEESEQLRAAFKDTIENAVKRFEELNGIIDEDLLQATGPRGLQGAIRRELTEATASELTGLFRGQFDLTKRNLLLNEQRFELEKRAFDAAQLMVSGLGRIEANTAATVLQLQAAVTELKSIKNNTAPSQTGRDLGLGG